TGAMGDRVRVSGVETSGGWDVGYQVLRPDGTSLCATTGTLMDCVLDAAGAHTIFVYDRHLSGTGSYNLFLQRLSGPTGCATVVLGAVTCAAITAAAGEDCYVFSGATGGRFRVSVTETSAAWDAGFQILRPIGTSLCSTTGVSIECTLDA